MPHMHETGDKPVVGAHSRAPACSTGAARSGLHAGHRLAKAAAAVLATLAFGCATVPPPAGEPLPCKGGELRSLVSEVKVTMESGEKKMTGTGYLLLRKPDRLRLTVLGPFGITLADIFVVGDDAYYMVPSERAAYGGSIAGMPDRKGLQGWRLLKWVLDTPRSATEGTVTTGEGDTVTYGEHGLVRRKVSRQGDSVVYEKYACVGGLPLASTLSATDRYGDRVRLELREPEVNGVLEAEALTPPLEGVTIVPWSFFPEQ